MPSPRGSNGRERSLLTDDAQLNTDQPQPRTSAAATSLEPGSSPHRHYLTAMPRRIMVKLNRSRFAPRLALLFFSRTALLYHTMSSFILRGRKNIAVLLRKTKLHAMCNFLRKNNGFKLFC
jgi:hypothetical protein